MPNETPDPKGLPSPDSHSKSHRDDLIVVGVGASAGGFEALTELLQRLPHDSNMAFVIIQHLDPRHESILPDLLSRHTSLRVVAVQHDVRLDGNVVYVIAPNTLLRIEDGCLVPEKRPPEGFKPIDSFFNSLSAEYKERAVGVVLSGTANDGTFGLKRIKADGGITFAQDKSAKFDSMPRSAIAAGAVDFILSPRQIAEELIAVAQRPRIAAREGAMAGEGQAMRRLLRLLRNESGVDFAQYKQPTIARRLNRRMVVKRRRASSITCS